MESIPSASYSLTLRVEIPHEADKLGELFSAIGQAGGVVGAIDTVRIRDEHTVRDITVNARDVEHGRRIVAAVEGLSEVRVVNVSDRTFLLHLGGKIEVRPKIPVRTRDDLSMVYTPGVARVSEAIVEDPERAFNLTIRANMVAVVSDGSAVLGLGDVGPLAALPVMEGKAALFKQFGGVDAFPICLDTKDPDQIVDTVVRIAPNFGGINLEDIAAPRCFEVEDRLREALEIPVFHDDQHGTAVVVLAALLNALRVVGKEPGTIRAVVNGLGAAGTASTKMLLSAGVVDLVCCDSRGIVHPSRNDLTPVKRWVAEQTNPGGLRGGLGEALRGADVFIGVSSAGVLTPEHLELMAPDPIVFAMANPVPEIMPELARGKVAVMATGRSDYPNQINNVLCFPGIFRGALDCRASSIDEEMKLAAARAIAGVIPADQLVHDYVVPSVFDERVAPAVAEAVSKAAVRTGAARRPPS